jgi:ankyrin repeat protein
MSVKINVLLLIFLATFALVTHSQQLRVVDAVRNGDIDTVKSLIRAGADVNIPDAEGSTALSYAAHQNNTEMVDALLSAGTDINTPNEYGATPVYIAAANADAKLIEKLLMAGGDPNTGLLSGETPLMVAAERGKFDAVKILLNYDADPNAQEHHAGQTALMWAIAEKHGEVADLLVEYEADVGLSTKSGFSPLMFAVQQGDLDTVGALLTAGAEIDEVMPKSGVNPLMIATVGGFDEIVKLLLEKGAEPNSTDSNGVTPLHEAAKDAHALNIIRTLIEYGADPNARIAMSKSGGNSANQGYGGSVRTPTGVSLKGATPLFNAAGLNRLENVMALLDAGADPLIANDTNLTALMMVAGAGTGVNSTGDEPPEAVAIARLLIERGANVKNVGHFGWTPLHLAAYHGYNNIIQLLVVNGADPNVMDGFGQTPLSISHAIVTEGIGDAYTQTPRSFRRETANLLLSLGAIPLEESGVKVVSRRASE